MTPLTLNLMKLCVHGFKKFRRDLVQGIYGYVGCIMSFWLFKKTGGQWKQWRKHSQPLKNSPSPLVESKSSWCLVSMFSDKMIVQSKLSSIVHRTLYKEGFSYIGWKKKPLTSNVFECIIPHTFGGLEGQWISIYSRTRGKINKQDDINDGMQLYWKYTNLCLGHKRGIQRSSDLISLE